MDDEELVRKLKERGYVIGPSVVRDGLVMLWPVNDVFMLRRDAMDLANGATSLDDVIGQGRGKVFPTARLTELDKFQDRVFQELRDMEDTRKGEIIVDLLAVVKRRGLTIDDVLRVLDTQGRPGILKILRAEKSDPAQ